ncbi:MAG TPA: pirin family protein, partial [Puia sp.]|nr:pirin family protein [Puia sp.]
MKKEVRTILQNQPVWINDTEVQLVLPAKHLGPVGPFILLDHISSWRQSSNKTASDSPGKCPVPHRGVITVTYIIKGQIEHSDSRGNHVSLEAGCMQWLNAGSGIVCDQDIKPAFKQGETEISVIRAWINPPANQKLHPPEYVSLCHDE